MYNLAIMDHIAKYPSNYAQIALLFTYWAGDLYFYGDSNTHFIIFFTIIYIDTCMDYLLFWSFALFTVVLHVQRNYIAVT